MDDRYTSELCLFGHAKNRLVPGMESQCKFGPMDWQQFPGLEIDSCLYYFFWHRMNEAPILVVLSILQDNQIERTEFVADLREVCVVTGVTSDEYSARRSREHK